MSCAHGARTGIGVNRGDLAEGDAGAATVVYGRPPDFPVTAVRR